MQQNFFKECFECDISDCLVLLVNVRYETLQEVFGRLEVEYHTKIMFTDWGGGKHEIGSPFVMKAQHVVRVRKHTRLPPIYYMDWTRKKVDCMSISEDDILEAYADEVRQAIASRFTELSRYGTRYKDYARWLRSLIK